MQVTYSIHWTYNISYFHNISYLCSSIAIFVKNCYSTPSRPFIGGGTEITSREETTQVDPVSIAIYGVGVTPLIIMLISILSNEYSPNVNGMAYADDFPAAGNLQDLRRWWSVLKETEIWLLSRANKDLASSVFFGTKISITTEGCRYLGGSVGTRKFKDLYITAKVN